MRMKYAIGLAALLLPSMTTAQAPKANGETLTLQHYAGTTGNMHAVVAAQKGFCTRYNFKCELKNVNSGILGLQTLVGKSIDVAYTGIDLTAATVNAGADLVVVGTGITNSSITLSVRSDVNLPNRPKGYPAVMADFKGLKVGVPARGAAAEVYMNVMLRDGGLQTSDVTYVAVGGPTTAYSSMVVGKQVDAVVLFEPVKSLCNHTKACTNVVDLTQGEGPTIARAHAAPASPSSCAANSPMRTRR